jgi:isopentenyldiphosphate isomerase
MEYIDVVDKEDNVIDTASKQEIYKKLLPHRIAHVIVFNDKGELALQLRSPDVSYCPDHWVTTAGGHVQAGEDPEQAAIREFKEELGIDNKDKLEFFSKDLYVYDKKINKFLITFKTKLNGPFKPDPKVVSKVEFFSIEKIKEMINNNEKFHPELLFLLNKYFF